MKVVRVTADMTGKEVEEFLGVPNKANLTKREDMYMERSSPQRELKRARNVILEGSGSGSMKVKNKLDEDTAGRSNSVRQFREQSFQVTRVGIIVPFASFA